MSSMVEQKGNIAVEHVNIRQSISVLVAKLVLVDLFAGIGVIVFHSIFIPTNLAQNIGITFDVGTVSIFLFLVLAKIFISCFIVLQWLNEYYEITANAIIHRRGIIWRKEDRYVFSHITSMKLNQGIWGKVFNYGTIGLYDRFYARYAMLSYIHNPTRYYAVLKKILPNVDAGKDVIREHIFDSDDDE